MSEEENKQLFNNINNLYNYFNNKDEQQIIKMTEYLKMMKHETFEDFLNNVKVYKYNNFIRMLTYIYINILPKIENVKNNLYKLNKIYKYNVQESALEGSLYHTNNMLNLFNI